jgi:hypothetical protein
MHNRGAGEVVEVHSEARQEVAFRAHRGEEAIGTPAPVAKDRIDDAGDAEGIEHVAHEPCPADHRAGADRRRAVGEGKLEEIVRQDRNARGGVGRQDVDVLHENQALGRVAREMPADKGVASAEHERKPPSPVQQAAHAGVEHAFHQHVDGFTIPTEARLEHGEAGLHAENEEGAQEHPGRVDRVDEAPSRNAATPDRAAVPPAGKTSRRIPTSVHPSVHRAKDGAVRVPFVA